MRKALSAAENLNPRAFSAFEESDSGCCWLFSIVGVLRIRLRRSRQFRVSLYSRIKSDMVTDV